MQPTQVRREGVSEGIALRGASDDGVKLRRRRGENRRRDTEVHQPDDDGE